MSRLGVQNIFEFLADENDDNKARAQPRKAAAPAAAAQPKPKPAGDKPVGDKPVRPPKEDRPKAAAGDAQAPRKPREQREPREPREPRPPRDNANRPPRQFAPRTDNAAPAGAAPAGAAPAEANLEEKPGSQVGRRGDRPPRQAGGDVNRDKSNTRVFKDRVRHETPKDRIFDRKSGTGRSDKEIKKGGSGKGNWGKEGEEAKEILATEDAPVKEAKGEATEERTDDVAADAAVDPEAPQQPPAKPNLGLEEYQALKQKERANLDSLLNDFKKKEAKERNPTDEQSWEGFKVLKRDEEDSKAAQAKKEKAAKKEKKAPVVLPVNFAAGDAKPNTKGKGKGKAPGDAKPTAPSTPDVTNKDAFPALRATPTPVATSS